MPPITGTGIELMTAPNFGMKPPMRNASAPAYQKSCTE